MADDVFFDEADEKNDLAGPAVVVEGTGENPEPPTTEPEANKANGIVTEEYEKVSDTTAPANLSLPSIPLLDFNFMLKGYSNLSFENPGAGMQTWRRVSQEAIEHYTHGGLYQKRFEEEGSEFSQGCLSKEGKLNSITSMKFRKTDGELQGEIALLKVAKLLGIGDVVIVPLPHSGICVTIKPPAENDLIDFYNAIFREKIALGRATYGLTLSNFSVHINKVFFEFIQKHIHGLNYSDITVDQLGNYMLINDFPILAWGFACAMFPNGYDYERACTADITKCSHVTKAVLNLTKLLLVDNPSLTQAQRNILEEMKPGKLTTDSYRKYITEHVRVSSTTVKISDDFSVKLRIPTFNEYTSDGLTWINKINNAVEVVLMDSEHDEDSKTEALNQHVKASILRQFSHYIEHIEFEENVVTHRETLNKTLELLSADDVIRNKTTEAVLKFKEDTTIALIGIPEYKCPSCKQPQTKKEPSDKYSAIIPLEVMQLSFFFLTSRISKILEREV